MCDVTDEAAVRACFANICAAHGRIDCLVNNAGISAVGDVLKATGAELDRVYAVNVKGVFHCLKAGVEKMLADGKGGAIVNLASIASLIASIVLPFIRSRSNHTSYPRASRLRTIRSIVLCTSHWYDTIR